MSHTSSDSVDLCSLCIRLTFCPEAFSFVPFCGRQSHRLIFWWHLRGIALSSHHIANDREVSEDQTIPHEISERSSASEACLPSHTSAHHLEALGWLMRSWTLLTPLDCVCVSLSLSSVFFFWFHSLVIGLTPSLPLRVLYLYMWVIPISLRVTEINTLPHGKKNI